MIGKYCTLSDKGWRAALSGSASFTLFRALDTSIRTLMPSEAISTGFRLHPAFSAPFHLLSVLATRSKAHSSSPQLRPPIHRGVDHHAFYRPDEFGVERTQGRLHH